MEPETYQDLIEPREADGANFAVIDAIYVDGVTLKFDGMDEPTEKHYKCNSSVVFEVGDRVKIVRDSNTYVVEYPVGNPRKTLIADRAGYAENAGHAIEADTAARLTGNADYASRAGSASNLFSDGYENRSRIWLAYSGGSYYISAENGSRRRIMTE